MSAATIGALKVVLGLDAAEFEGGLTRAQKELRKAGREFQKIGQQISDVGKTMSTALTLPIVGLGLAVTKTAADFETAMNRVSISTGATGETFKQLTDLAREIGRETVFSASTAADAIDMLAKSGVSVEDILGGAARAAVDLAAAAGTELDPAAAAITDSMAQFKLTVEDLPRIVNGITGAVNESKLDFSDFTLAIGQAGGVAANLGVTFEDFNTVLAATSPLFASGSDAGTSFKTFLQRMVPTTKQAAEMMAQYGLTFHDAAGNMRPMADIAQMLQDKLGGLSDQAKTQVLSRIFGTDSMRTAIALMDQGADGLDKIAAKIAATDAAAQSAKRMEGLNGQLEQLGGAFEELAIAIGNSGLLETVGKVVQGIAGIMEKIAAANPVLLQVGLVFAAVAAAIGPVLMVIGSLISAVGTITAAFGGAGLLAVLAPLAPILLAVGAAIAVAVAAFLKFKDQIIPVLQNLWSVAQKTLGPALGDLFKTVGGLLSDLGAAFDTVLKSEVGQTLVQFATLYASVFGEVAIRALTLFVRLVTAGLQLIGDSLSVLGDLLTGDFAGAWEGAKRLVSNLAQNLGKAFADIGPRAVEAMRMMAEGVRNWLLGRLGDTMKWVIDRVKQVGDAFHNLYIRVVGNSDIPDMVTEVGDWMAKLQETLVDPAERATKKAGDAFEDLRRRVQGIVRDLMTDREKLDLGFADESATLDEAGRKGLLSPDVLAELRRRLEKEFATASGGLDAEGMTTPDAPRLTPLVDLPGVKAINDAVDRMNQAIHDSRERFADSFAYGIESALRGDWQGVLRAVFGNVMNDALRSVGRSIFNAGGGGSGGFNLGNIFSSVGSWFSKLPGFKTGGSFTVGGSGGIDSSLVAFRATPGEMVDIRRPGQDGGASRVIHEVIVRPERDSFITLAADAAVPVARGAAAQMGRTVLDASRRSAPAVQESQSLLGTT